MSERWGEVRPKSSAERSSPGAESRQRSLPRARKHSDADAQLQRVNPRIERANPRIGDVHVADFSAPIEFLAQDVHPQRATRREIYAGSSRRNLSVANQRPTVQIGVRHDTAVRIEIPFESERIEGYTVRSEEHTSE